MGKSNKKLSIPEIISRFKVKHGEIYNYDLIKIYNGSKSKLPVICQTHGIFYLSYEDHYYKGSGCSTCSSNKRGFDKRKSLEEFVKEASYIHKNKYDYSLSKYIGAHVKLEIICPKHGTFEQTPDNHLRGGVKLKGSKSGTDCPECSIPYRKSKTANGWLESLNITKREVRLPNLPNRWKVDGYDPITNTVYQFHGDYWHGNPQKYTPEVVNAHNKKTMGVLYQETMEKEKHIKDAGYNLITMWENDWRIKYRGGE